MSRIIGLMAMAVRTPTAATGSGNRTRPHITQLSDLQLNGGATRFQVSRESRACKISFNLAYYYARLKTTKKGNSRITTFMSHTPSKATIPHTPTKVKLLVEAIEHGLSTRKQFSFADVNRHLDFDCDRYIRLLGRLGFLFSEAQRPAWSMKQLIRRETLRPPN